MKLKDYLTEQAESCPASLKSIKTNIKNHMMVIKEHGLGPIDPRQPNEDFWKDKALKWKVSEGDARGRLCLNCEHYLQTEQIDKCIVNGPIKNFKTSSLPMKPAPVDIESRPVAWCMLYDITCSPTRVCDSQEEGGPIDNFKAKKLGLDNIDFDKVSFEDLDHKTDQMDDDEGEED